MPRSRRRQSGSPVSFFAFQDIITAVSGIVIVMVLLLSLELIQRPTLAKPVTVEVRDELKATIEEARLELRRLEAGLADRDRLIKELAEMTPKETERQIRTVKQNIIELEHKITLLQEQRSRLEEEKKRVEVRHFDQKDARDELAELQRRIEQLKKELDREETTDRPIFALPRGVDKQGWVVVVSGSKIQAAPMNRVQAPISFDTSDELIDWTNRMDTSSAYLLILVRPSGLDDFEALRPSLRRNDISFGFDLVGADEKILDPIRGAAP